MSLGLGIFLSAVFLGIIALFLATRDRWNWRKIVLWPICAVLVLSILGGIGFYVYNRPKPQTSFWGISLNSTAAGVKFMKGTPADSIDENLWVYKQTYSSNREATVFVRFQDGNVKGVVFSGSRSSQEPALQGIKVNDNLDKVIKKFGEPSYISRHQDELSRIYSFSKYNLVFWLTANKVTMYGIYNPALGPSRFREEAND